MDTTAQTTPATDPASAGPNWPAAAGSGWVRTEDDLPLHGQRVLAHYDGVYGYRLVTFWRDGGSSPHFGMPAEADGRGSQPATHWHPLPPLPNTEVSRDGA